VTDALNAAQRIPRGAEARRRPGEGTLSL